MTSSTSTRRSADIRRAMRLRTRAASHSSSADAATRWPVAGDPGRVTREYRAAARDWHECADLLERHGMRVLARDFRNRARAAAAAAGRAS